MYYVYALKSLKNGQLYIGRSGNLKLRVKQHLLGECRTTNRLLPMKLVFYEAFITKIDSIRREKYFKTSKGKSSLKQIIRESVK